jgi:4-amino-4-deoxy-L-arabinose transferase-like glycosyltransferase
VATARPEAAWAPWALFAVLLLALALRVVHLAGNPPDLIPDELDLYNSMHSYVLTGHDIDGTRQLFLKSEAPFRKLPIYALAAYGSSLLFGNGPFGLRYPAAVFGAVAFAYGIMWHLTRRRDAALAAALVMATQPIFIHLARIAWETSAELPFLLGGVYFWLRAFDEDGNARRDLALGAILFALGAYTYPATWFYAVLLGGSILARNVARIRTRDGTLATGGAVLIWLVLIVPALWEWHADPSAQARYATISTFAGGVTPATLWQFVQNYAAHFRWSFLVTTGDPKPGTTWRYLAGFGAFSWWTVALAAAGCIGGLLGARTRSASLWLLWWLVIYPLGGALGNDGVPNATRTLAGAPAFPLFAALAVALIVDRVLAIRDTGLRRKVSATLAAVAALNVALSLALFLRAYFSVFPSMFPNAWTAGSRATFAIVRAEAPRFARLCFAVQAATNPARSYFRYYLADRTIPVFEPAIVAAPECNEPGTLFVADKPLQGPGLVPIAAALEPGGGIFSIVYGSTSSRALGR